MNTESIYTSSNNAGSPMHELHPHPPAGPQPSGPAAPLPTAPGVPSGGWRGGLRPALRTTIVAFDIAGFGDRRRTDHLQLQLRGELYRVLQEAFAMTALAWRECYHEDRGDGVMVIAPPDVPTELFMDPLAHHLTAILRRRNLPVNDTGRIRLRQAVHTGQVLLDDHGVTGQALIRAFRLLDAPAFKTLFTQAGTDLAMIASEQTYTDATAHGGLINPDAYQQLQVSCKETDTHGWVWLPTPPQGQRG
ncbi:hypothetical protein GCM10010411_74510 [Actinomadura fulvescens]|uniref:Guanylate cyclase domain-containing protein n=1 Tax=Actinomadura fulvescens TaxID=46160 RepID=A0ABP6CRD4_9ACTN